MLERAGTRPPGRESSSNARSAPPGRPVEVDGAAGAGVQRGTCEEDEMSSRRRRDACRGVSLGLAIGAVLVLCGVRAVAQIPDLGIGASLHGKPIFPAGNPWNQDISTVPVDPNSANLIASMGLTSPLHPDFGTTYQSKPIGFPYIVV